ncbi:ribosome biogenesis GTP-binding protein YihA/YsxC [candidate division KSB1 bacterium]
MKIKKAAFLTSVADTSSLPESNLPAVVFAGRSNVGKSSLINAILNRKNLAKTSSTPGKTRLINYFYINDNIHFIDLPGYGYAKVSRKMQNEWRELIESFFVKNDNIKLVFVLSDVRRGLKEMDIQLLEWLKVKGFNTRIVLTKCDKISKNETFKLLKSVKEQLEFQIEPIVFSAVKRIGIDNIWGEINTACTY